MIKPSGLIEVPVSLPEEYPSWLSAFTPKLAPNWLVPVKLTGKVNPPPESANGAPGMVAVVIPPEVRVPVELKPKVVSSVCATGGGRGVVTPCALVSVL